MNIAEWSSLVARRAHNPKVVGSNPASATTKNGLNNMFEPFFFCSCDYKMYELGLVWG